MPEMRERVFQKFFGFRDNNLEFTGCVPLNLVGFIKESAGKRQLVSFLRS
jgi:hypothetical protein